MIYKLIYALFLVPHGKQRFSTDRQSQALLGGVSTWMGDHLETLVVGFLFLISQYELSKFQALSFSF